MRSVLFVGSLVLSQLVYAAPMAQTSSVSTSLTPSMSPGCVPEAIRSEADPSKLVGACLDEGNKLGLQHFPAWLKDKMKYCESFSKHEASPSEYMKACVSDALIGASQVLSCPQELRRYDEAVAFDLIDFENRFGSEPEVPLPLPIAQAFQQLTQAAESKFGHQFRLPKWSLRAFQVEGVNATAGAGGIVAIHSTFWEGPAPYAQDEIMAVLAHEIGHVILEHGLKLGCLAIEWIGPEYSIAEAQESFRDDLMSALERKDDWMKRSQSYEYEADQIAVTLMKEIGMDPRSMVRTLIKMSPKTEGGFVSGSHPQMSERIKALENFIRKMVEAR